MNIKEILDVIGTNGQVVIMKEGLETVCDGLFNLFFNWRKQSDKLKLAESDIIAQCILQIAICKIRTLLSMCNGISIMPKDEHIKVIDVPSMISVLRSLYELTFVFHNIYAEQDSPLERDIVLYIWEIRGLNNRQNLPYVPIEYVEKEDEEKKQISVLREKVELLAEKLHLSEELKKQLRKVTASTSVDIKGYRFKKDIENKRIVAFEDVRFKDGAEDLLKTNAPTYRFLSIHGHPSYLGVLQFGQLFNNETDKEFLRTIVTCACKLASTMAVDFRNHITGADEIFTNLDEKSRSYIETLYNS